MRSDYGFLINVLINGIAFWFFPRVKVMAGVLTERKRARLQEDIDRQDPELPNFFVDKEVLRECWAGISPCIHISNLLPYLIQYGLVAGDDLFILNNASVAPGHKKTLLSQVIIGLGDEACHLLYICISQDSNSHLGHDDAREKLESKGV